MVLACWFIAALGALPAANGSVTVTAQEWPYQPGPREVTVYLRYPGGQLSEVNAGTGLFLVLHNWNGTEHAGAADPQQVADRYNVVAISVDYLQSGKQTPGVDPPYDYGYLQAVDALRALAHVYRSIEDSGIEFARDRIYATGSSGGGNVTLQVNKLAPHTFACIVDLCGMARLSDDIAFNLDGGSELNAGYSRDPESPRHLTVDEQQIRTPAHLPHIKRMKALGNTAKIIVVHGAEDSVCPVEDAREMVKNMRQSGLDMESHFVDQAKLDGEVYTSTGHPLGDRTRIVFDVADKYLLSDSPDMRRLTGPPDFVRGERVEYTTPAGKYAINFADGTVTAAFMSTASKD